MQIGQYQVVEEIARGGMGVVYLACGPNGEEVAIKLLLAAGFAGPGQQLRFRRESTALATLDHPGILRVRSHGVDDGRPYMVMDLLLGATLEDVVKREGPLSEERVVELGVRMAAALGHAHSRGVLHRDLKPANIVLQGNEPVLVDFGLAYQLGLDESRLTETGAVMGSPSFMAPEQAMGQADVGPAADLYGIGATLYCLLSGRPPFEGEGTLEILKRVASEDPRPLERPGLTPELEAVVLRCLEKEPDRRFPTAFALEQALGALAESFAVVRGKPGPNRAGFAILVALLLAAAAVVVLVVDSTPRPAEPSAPPPAIETASERRERAQTLLESGDAKAELERYDAAIEDFDRALDLDPQSTNAYVSRARSKALLGRNAEALEDLDRALELDPQAATAYLGRGAIKATLGEYVEAIENYDRAIELDPLGSDPYVQRGMTKASLGRDAEAIEDYDRAIKLDPRAQLAYAYRGESRAHLGRFEEAIADCDRALELDPNANDYLSRGTSKARLGRHAEAIEDLDLALELNPGSGLAYANRGSSKDYLGRPQEAIEDFDRALELELPQATADLVRQWRADAAARLRR